MKLHAISRSASVGRHVTVSFKGITVCSKIESATFELFFYLILEFAICYNPSVKEENISFLFLRNKKQKLLFQNQAVWIKNILIEIIDCRVQVEL